MVWFEPMSNYLWHDTTQEPHEPGRLKACGLSNLSIKGYWCHLLNVRPMMSVLHSSYPREGSCTVKPKMEQGDISQTENHHTTFSHILIITSLFMRKHIKYTLNLEFLASVLLITQRCKRTPRIKGRLTTVPLIRE